MIRFILLLSLAILVPTASAQHDNTKTISYFSAIDDLSSNDVTSIIEDDAGFMWFATTNGLSRYDGYEIKTFRSDATNPSLFLSNNIVMIEKDHDGKIWVATTKEIAIFDPQRNRTTRIETEYGLSSKVKAMICTKSGDMLLGTSQGVYVYNRQSSKFELIIHECVMALFEDSNGVIWVGTWGSGALTFDLNNYTQLTRYTNDKIKNLNVTSFTEDSRGKIWFSTWELPGKSTGLVCLEEPQDNLSDKIKLFSYGTRTTDLNSVVLYKLVYNKKHDDIWIATAKGISILKDPSNSSEFINLSADDLNGDDVQAIYCDTKNIVWASVSGAGVNKITTRNDAFKHFTYSKYTNGNKAVSAIYEDNVGNVWLGVRHDVLVIWDKKNGQIRSHKEDKVLGQISVDANSVTSIIRDNINDNLLWLGTRYEGVYLVQMENNTPQSLVWLKEGRYDVRAINEITQDPQGRLWVGAVNGLYTITEHNGVYTTEPVEAVNSKINNEIVNSVIHFDDDIWVGTMNYGILRINADGRVTEYNLALKNLNYGNVLCFFKDSKDQLWVGTQGGGLSKYNKQTDSFDALSTNGMFTNDAVYSIIEDADENLWISTAKGLASFKINNEESARWYSRKDGVQNLQFLRQSALKLSTSELVFGGYNGVDCFASQLNTADTIMHKTAIVDIRVMNTPIENLVYSEEIESELLPPYAKELTLTYNQNNISLVFSSLSFSNPKFNRYAYRMVGIDTDWIYVDAKNRHISYSNLKQGAYIFEVKSCNESSIWSEPISLGITILPAPWFTWWAYVIYSVLISILIYVVYRIVNGRIRLKNELKIEHIERVKTEETSVAKLNFVSNISHELFTQLSIMQYAFEDVQGHSDEQNKSTEVMKLNIKRLTRLMQQIMEFRKAETGNLKLKVSYGDIYAQIREICLDNFTPLLKKKNISLDLKCDNESVMGYFDHDKVDKIIYNLVSNAIKYNYQGGHISIVLGVADEDSGMVTITVSNTGEGIPKEKLESIFKRFYDGEYRKYKTTGTGIGLSLTKELVELHKGRISVQSVENQLTTFEVVFSISKERYVETEIEERCAPVQTDSSFDSSSQRINDSFYNVLLVEDEDDLAHFTIKFLNNNFNVIRARNGREALDILRDDDRQTDLIIADYMMPSMNGMELCREVRKDVTISHLPIIMLTAMVQVEDYLNGYEAGADVYLVKPADMSVLSAQIKALIENRKLSANRFKESEEVITEGLGLLPLDQEFLDNAISIVHRNMADSDFSIEVFSQAIAMSQSTLYRKVKSLTGMSPNEFIRDIRIKSACNLLKRSDLQIADVAYMVGFSDPKYFSIIFKKYKGMSPTKYIETILSYSKVG